MLDITRTYQEHVHRILRRARNPPLKTAPPRYSLYSIPRNSDLKREWKQLKTSRRVLFWWTQKRMELKTQRGLKTRGQRPHCLLSGSLKNGFLFSNANSSARELSRWKLYETDAKDSSSPRARNAERAKPLNCSKRKQTRGERKAGVEKRERGKREGQGEGLRRRLI